MADVAVKKHTREPLITIAKRDDMPWWKAWGIRLIAIAVAFVLTGFISAALAK